jgi:NTP pyrophosphatase (non-canonical NTP hydrolase)
MRADLFFNSYQQKARSFAVYPENMKLLYPVIGLAGESGEVCEKFKKIYRDSEGVISDKNRRLIALELGDVLWYVSNIAADLDLRLSDVARMNIEKLSSREKRGVLKGSGDER